MTNTKGWTPEEQSLYDEARKLKQKAREMRRKREAADDIKKHERVMQKNARVKSALLRLEEAFTSNGVNFLVDGTKGDKIHAFTIMVEGWDSPIGVRFVAGTGFEWD